jgi:hypothetical protein
VYFFHSESFLYLPKYVQTQCQKLILLTLRITINKENCTKGAVMEAVAMGAAATGEADIGAASKGAATKKVAGTGVAAT